MKPSTGQRSKRLWIFLLAVLFALLGLFAWRVQRGLPERLRQAVLAQGWSLRIDGGSERGFLRVNARNVTLAPQSGGDRLSASVERVEISGLTFGEPHIVFDGVELKLHGDPFTLFEQLGQALGSLPTNFVVRRVEVSYPHQVWRTLRLTNVQVSRGAGPEQTYTVRAGTIVAGPRQWSDVVLEIGKRKEMLEIVVGAAASTAGGPTTRLMVFDSNHKTASWLLDIAHQPARPLLTRVAWDPGPAFDRTQIRAAISLKVPFDEAQPVDGNVQVTVDGWPKPGWPEAEALLGQTGSIFARFAPAPGGTSWVLPHVEVTLPLFSLVGTGRLAFADAPLLAIEISGERSCALLGAHLRPSRYLDQVRAHLQKAVTLPVPAGEAELKPPGVGLRLHAAVGNLRGEGAQVIWTLGEGCGISL